ncbi:hypothetical protein NUU61_005004 [Penicillium alfredii]|uniref:Uncharacterized protein n=1 Tax=Penicillium alfredii TaxID=1506179 RepID=A0A9W9F8Q8_9EURO|nr:uncharacterized protein NUU61_005004 [Penicillium alfredii]KAJ5095648.1 hypothetical protein NUU61_005004 [Penicillium alfredii]
MGGGRGAPAMAGPGQQVPPSMPVGMAPYQGYYPGMWQSAYPHPPAYPNPHLYPPAPGPVFQPYQSHPGPFYPNNGYGGYGGYGAYGGYGGYGSYGSYGGYGGYPGYPAMSQQHSMGVPPNGSMSPMRYFSANPLHGPPTQPVHGPQGMVQTNQLAQTMTSTGQANQAINQAQVISPIQPAETSGTVNPTAPSFEPRVSLPSIPTASDTEVWRQTPSSSSQVWGIPLCQSDEAYHGSSSFHPPTTSSYFNPTQSTQTSKWDFGASSNSGNLTTQAQPTSTRQIGTANTENQWAITTAIATTFMPAQASMITATAPPFVPTQVSISMAMARPFVPAEVPISTQTTPSSLSMVQYRASPAEQETQAQRERDEMVHYLRDLLRVSPRSDNNNNQTTAAQNVYANTLPAVEALSLNEARETRMQQQITSPQEFSHLYPTNPTNTSSSTSAPVQTYPKEPRQPGSQHSAGGSTDSILLSGISTVVNRELWQDASPDQTSRSYYSADEQQTPMIWNPFRHNIWTCDTLSLSYGYTV